MTTSTLKGVLFDKDGTLIDFYGTWLPAYRRGAAVVAEIAGRPGIEDQLLAVAGYDPESGRFLSTSLLSCGTTEEIAAVWAKQAELGDTEIASRIEAIFNEDAPGLATPVEDLHAVMERLETRGMVLGVATMDSRISAETTLARLGIDRHLSFVCGYDSGHGQKPGRGMVDAFCAATGLVTAEIVLVGDTPHDLDMGRAAEVGRVVGVLTGTSTREQLTPLCDAVIPSIVGLEALLDGWAAENAGV